MTNPTDPAKEVVYAYARMNGIKGSDYMQPLADLIQSYGDQREAAARADERAAVVAWLEEQREKNGAEGWNISLLALGILRCEHMKGSGDEQG